MKSFNEQPVRLNRAFSLWLLCFYIGLFIMFYYLDPVSVITEGQTRRIHVPGEQSSWPSRATHWVTFVTDIAKTPNLVPNARNEYLKNAAVCTTAPDSLHITMELERDRSSLCKCLPTAFALLDAKSVKTALGSLYASILNRVDHPIAQNVGVCIVYPFMAVII